MDSSKVSANISRSEQRNIEFKEKISLAALHLFSIHGIEETSVTAIIKQADIAHKTFFNHFANKQHLISFITCEYSKRLFTFNVSKELGLSPLETIEHVFLNMAKTIETLDDNYQKLARHLLINVPTGPEDLINKQTRALVIGITGQLNKALKAGQLHTKFSVETYCDVTSALLINVIMNWGGQKDYPLLSKLETAIAFIKESIFLPEQ